MADKPNRLRTVAAADLADATDYYRDNAGEQVALGFVDEVQAAFTRIASGPAIGGLRYSYDLDIPGLRALPIKRFAYEIFYVEADEVIDVWRVLHTRRDIPETLRQPDE